MAITTQPGKEERTLGLPAIPGVRTGKEYDSDRHAMVHKLIADDNSAFVSMRRASPEEQAQSRAARLGGIVGTGGATMGADTGMGAGSRAAMEHGAALARHTGGDVTGGGYSQQRLGGMLAANRAAGFSGGRIGAGRLIGRAGAMESAARRKDFLEAARIQNEREGADADRADKAADRAESARQFDERMRQYGYDRAANAELQGNLLEAQKQAVDARQQREDALIQLGILPEGMTMKPPTFAEQTAAEQTAADKAAASAENLLRIQAGIDKEESEKTWRSIADAYLESAQSDAEFTPQGWEALGGRKEDYASALAHIRRQRRKPKNQKPYAPPPTPPV